jgi:hypothetical protein
LAANCSSFTGLNSSTEVDQGEGLWYDWRARGKASYLTKQVFPRGSALAQGWQLYTKFSADYHKCQLKNRLDFVKRNLSHHNIILSSAGSLRLGAVRYQRWNLVNQNLKWPNQFLEEFWEASGVIYTPIFECHPTVPMSTYFWGELNAANKQNFRSDQMILLNK